MWPRRSLVVLTIAIACLSVTFAAAPAAQSDEAKFRLKPGAKGKVCLSCHVDFEEKLKLPSVHTPVKAGACSDCHSPHAAEHGKLLAEPPAKICLSCHQGIVPAGAKSVHKDAFEGTCVACHDPHAAKGPAVLRESGSALCLSCHKDLGAQVAANRFKHSPVEKSCLGCHDPHAAPKTDHLLVTDEPILCVSCHRPESANFAKDHAGYPVAKGRCTSCHDPHGSSQPGILWATVHKPVAAKQCAQCHNEPGSPSALGLKKPGLDGCRSCHAELVTTALAAKRIHWPVVDANACLNCHGPHATREAKLVRAPMKTVCGDCHADTLRRQERSASKHPPNEQGDCTACHEPHASEFVFLAKASGQLELCGSCHDWKEHQGHPIGEKVADPRNKSLTLDCSSCHRLHGTSHKYFTHGDSKAELCVGCHESFRR